MKSEISLHFWSQSEFFEMSGQLCLLIIDDFWK